MAAHINTDVPNGDCYMRKLFGASSPILDKQAEVEKTFATGDGISLDTEQLWNGGNIFARRQQFVVKQQLLKMVLFYTVF